jgi:hypothetical protein
MRLATRSAAAEIVLSSGGTYRAPLPEAQKGVFRALSGDFGRHFDEPPVIGLTRILLHCRGIVANIFDLIHRRWAQSAARSVSRGS